MKGSRSSSMTDPQLSPPPRLLASFSPSFRSVSLLVDWQYIGATCQSVCCGVFLPPNEESRKKSVISALSSVSILKIKRPNPQKDPCTIYERSEKRLLYFHRRGRSAPGECGVINFCIFMNMINMISISPALPSPYIPLTLQVSYRLDP